MVHSRAVQSAGYLLQRFEYNSVFTNHCVAKLLHRIAWEAKMPAMLFQASLFRSFQRIFKSALPQHKELQKLGQFVVRQFVAVASKNPLAFVELLFWKTSRDAYEIEEGYGSYKEKTTAEKKMWKEEEEDELRMLHAEFERDQPGGDVVDWIHSKLINQNHSKAGVSKKLRELFLVVPKSKKRPPKEWAEEEIAQLQELFQQYRDSGNPMEDVMSRLTVQRPKARVLDKLLELGLISDRKELRKKGGKSKTGNLRTGVHEINLSDDDIDSDDNHSDGSNDTNTPPRKANKKGTGNRDRIALKKARRGKTGRAPAGQVTAMLLQVVNSGFIEGLQWLKESFEEAADDLENDPTSEDVDGIPLVPVGDGPCAAMDSPIFQRMLQSLGIVPPFDEQETYWRIPGDMKAAEMRQKTAVVQMALDGTLSTEQAAEQLSDHTGEKDMDNREQSSDSEDEFNALRRITTANKDEGSTGANETPFDQLLKAKSAPGAEDASFKKGKRKRVKVVLSDDSDNDTTQETLDKPQESMDVETNISTGKTKKTAAYRNNISLDSDSDHDASNSMSETNNQSQRRALMDSDSENDGSGSGRQQNSQRSRLLVIDSDSDSENDGSASAVRQNTQRNRPLLIDSDSDSDNESPRRPSAFKSPSVKSSPLKESSILNNPHKSVFVSSDEEPEPDVTAPHQPKKGAKHLLSSSDGSDGELNSPKKARTDAMSKLRM